MPNGTLSRRELLARSATAGATLFLPGMLSAAPDGKRTFTILHTNDMHSSFIGMGPAADYSPFTPNDDATRGGYARLAAMIARRREARMAGARARPRRGRLQHGDGLRGRQRETGGELQLMSRIGYDATTLGNHEFDLGPDGLGQAIAVAARPAGSRRSSHRTRTSRRATRRWPARGWRRKGSCGAPRRSNGAASARHLRGPRQGGPDLHRGRRGDVLRRHRDRRRRW